MAFFQRRLTSTVLASALLAGLALPALAQSAPPAPPSGPGPAEARYARMHELHGERMEKFAAELKTKLQLTPAQESAWTTYTAAMKPQERARLDFQGLRSLTTPERIDRMHAMRAQHAAEADRRGEATKAFYAQLTPAQQKTFDEQTLHLMDRMHRMGPRHEGGRPGMPGNRPMGRGPAPAPAQQQ